MDLKMLSLLTAATVILVCSADAVSVSTNCCTEVSKDAPKKLLRHVKEYQIQKQDGICEIKAVVLHHKTKLYCVDLEGKNVKKWLKRKQRGRKNNGRSKKNNKKNNSKSKKNNKRRV
ncbi:C-C motif chemokine 28-like [Protopterus annectens]|uniref:C-C motif chemokine 28-like n=1 Tax=Protopterus annectens TaxID=7888 RepID=UPI001CFAE6FC|nr:C-C motif chemokine 28-like [Protopterus annectens]